jgi:hypothetical protein
MKTTSTIFPNNVKLSPKTGPCDSCKNNDHLSKQTVWLVPHVIKYKDDSMIISWRCNWGNICMSPCQYAMTRANVEGLTPKVQAQS